MIVSNLSTEILTGAFTVCDKAWARDGTIVCNDPFSRLYRIVQGQGEIHYSGGRLELCPGFLFVIPEHTPARYRAIGVMDLQWIHFRARLFGCLEIFSLMGWPLQVADPDPVRTHDQMGFLVEHSRPGRIEDSLRADAALRQLLSSFAAAGEKPQEERFRNFQRLLPAISFIEQNLHRKIRLEDLARVLPLQPAYLCHLFSRTIGQSPIDFINRKRIEKAQFLLQKETMTLKEVAGDVGFQDVYFFSRIFRKIVGVSPGSYKRQKQYRE